MRYDVYVTLHSENSIEVLSPESIFFTSMFFLNNNPVLPLRRPCRSCCTNLCVSVGINSSLFLWARFREGKNIHVSATYNFIYSPKSEVLDSIACTLARHKVSRGERSYCAGDNGVCSTTMQFLLREVTMWIFNGLSKGLCKLAISSKFPPASSINYSWLD